MSPAFLLASSYWDLTNDVDKVLATFVELEIFDKAIEREVCDIFCLEWNVA